jgi:ornithine cyclodeaminase
VRAKLREWRYYADLDLLADPDDPRDLFGMLQRAANAPLQLLS